VPFRPFLNYDKPADPAYTNLLQLVERCWHQDPAMRPDFIQINKEFIEISHGKYVNKPIITTTTIRGGSKNSAWGGAMTKALREPMTEIWSRAPSGVQGQSPWSGFWG